MKKKIITIGMIGMFLLTSLLVGTAVGKKTTQATSTSGNDLALELITETSWSNPVGTLAKIKNVGTETIYGPITVTLTMKKGFFGLFKFNEKTYTVLSDGKYLTPGDWVFGGDWSPDPSVRSSIYVFQYKLNVDDDNPDNNIDSQKYLILHYRMFWFGQHDI